MKIKNKFKYVFFISVLFFCSLSYAAEVEIGNEIDFEYRNTKRGDGYKSSDYRERVRFYFIGHLKDNIDVGLRINSSGIMNSTSTRIIYEGSEIKNLTPYFENAYIKLNNLYDFPVSLIFGKLPIKWADGILVNDNNLGLPAVKLNAEIPYNIDLEAFHCGYRNNYMDISNIKGYGLRFVKEFGFRRIELDYTLEDYESTQRVFRNIYGGNFTRNLHKGLEYSIFGYLMNGTKGEDDFDGYALGAYGKFEGVVDPLGKGGAWIRYILGTGNLNDDEKGFLPVLSSVESSILGDYYGRHREFKLINGSVSNELTLSHSISNLSMLKNALYATVFKDITVYFVRSTYKKHDPPLAIGGSISLGAKYTYSIVDFELTYTIFAPEDNYDYYEGSDEIKFITFGLSSRF